MDGIKKVERADHTEKPTFTILLLHDKLPTIRIQDIGRAGEDMTTIPTDHSIFMESVLTASRTQSGDVFSKLIKAIDMVVPYKMCSLWKVNNKASTVSLYARLPHEKADTSSTYVHDIEGSLIGKVITHCKDDNSLFFESDDITTHDWYKHHKFKDRVKEKKLKRFLSIPVPNSDPDHNTYKLDAVLNIYPADEVDINTPTILFLRDQISFALSNDRLKKREGLLLSIVDLYRNKKNKDIGSIVHPIIHRVLPSFMKFEGCSLFIWDPFVNVLSLAVTTGIEGDCPKSKIHYQLGEGLTGHTSLKGKPTIIKHLMRIDEKELEEEYEHKFCEHTRSAKTSFMAIPINSPSDPGERLGVIRFTNRLNPLSGTVDHFSKEDLDLISYAISLIALYIDNYQSDRKKSAFAAQLAHEINSPTFSILASLRRLITNISNQRFLDQYLAPYLTTILDNTDLQSHLTESIVYLWKRYSDDSITSKYRLSKTSMRSAITKSKNVVKAICRTEGILFDNITIQGQDFSVWFDEFALRQVFFNLLTNAIKYRVVSQPEDFKVRIKIIGKGTFSVPERAIVSSHEYSEEATKQRHKMPGHLVQFEDFGIGVTNQEKDKIFNMGYRRKGIEKTNVRGLGIGLTVIKTLLDDFGCYIWVSNLKNPTRLNLFFPERLTKAGGSHDLLD